ncbi:MAG: lactate racemase domain-containing protein [Candidatus Latescibacterota bacterium]|nr:lactate racemase domain-containing protein [Candidatus Latescibacterota bacterium]
MGLISLRSKAWHGDVEVQLSVPDSWSVEVLPPRDAFELDDSGLQQALCTPIGSPPLTELARGNERVLIVVDDLGRPTPAHRIIPFVLEHLRDAGVADGSISFLVATGSHRQLESAEMAMKIGTDVAQRFECHSHDAFHDELADLGRLPSGMPVLINRRVTDADLVIGISCVLPHSLAGFSGGGKILLPGCAGIQSISALHSFESKRLRAHREPLQRRPDTREVIAAFAERVGLGFSINTVINSRREIAGVHAGHFVKAHARAVDQARKVFDTPIPEDLRQQAELLIVNGYPLDADPVQISKSQWSCKLFPRATTIFHNPACDGEAYHGWSEFQKDSVLNMLCGAIGEARTQGRYPGMVSALLSLPFLCALGHRRLCRQAQRTDVSYRAFRARDRRIFQQTLAKRLMAKRTHIVICSEGFPEWKRAIQFPNSQLYSSWEEVGRAGHLPDRPIRVAVLTCAPLQIPS